MFKKILIGVIINSLALFVVTHFMPDIQYTGGIKFFILAGFIIGVLNTFVKPLMKILSFPLLLATIGLFTLVINAIIFWLTVQVVNGINIADVSVKITQPWIYLVAAFLFGMVNWLLHRFLK